MSLERIDGDERYASSTAVAAELLRRGRNSNDQYIHGRMEFMAGRLPRGAVTMKDIDAVLDEALLMSKRCKNELQSMVIGAFGEARFYN